MIPRLLSAIFGKAEEINGHNRCPTYLYRWHVARFGAVKVYLHRFVGDDWTLDLHDHPKRFISIGVSGQYIERTHPSDKAGSIDTLYIAPWLRTFPPSHRHRLKLLPDRRECWTLVFVGPTQREWGFWHRGFIPWREYVNDELADRMKACA